MKDRSMGKVCFPLAAVLAAVLCVALPLQAQVAKLSSPRTRAADVVRNSSSIPPGFPDAVVVASNSALIKSGAVVNGNVVVNFPGSAPKLGPDEDLFVERAAVVAGSISAQSIELARDACVQGAITTNQLDDKGATAGANCNQQVPLPSPYAAPIFSPLPPFQEANPNPSAPNVIMAAGDVRRLAPGDYGNVDFAGQGSTLCLEGGVYQFKSLKGGGSAQGARLLFQGPSDVRVEGQLDFGRNTTVKGEACPAPQAFPCANGICPTASQIVFYVKGANGPVGGPSGPNDLPAAANVGRDSVAWGTLYAPNGTVLIDKGCECSGAYLGRDVRLDGNVTVASAFRNAPPVAFPQSVETNGAASVTITLRGSDPEDGSLTFTDPVPVTPTKGTLSAITPIVPDAVLRCSVSNLDCNVTADCPLAADICESAGSPAAVTSATVVYTPNNPAANEEDSFTFEVVDPVAPPDTGKGTAVVSINPFDPSVAPPPTSVDATDQSVETTPGTPVVITLNAGACGGAIALRVLTLPSFGSLKDSNNDPITSPPGTPYPLPTPVVTFDPGATTGSTQFQFDATDNTCPGTKTDSATVTISVQDLPELAPDQTIPAPGGPPILTNQTVPVTLFANPGGTGTPPPALKAARAALGLPTANAPLPGATIAGNVSDASNDGLGDGKNQNLPGSAPLLISAGVDINLGSEPSGSISDGSGDSAGPDLVSATVTKSGSNLLLTVRFQPGTFNSSTTRAQFILDTDQNPATGSPGVDSGCTNDAAIIGGDFNVEIGGSLTAPMIRTATGGCNAFTSSSAGSFTLVADGLDASVPLASLGGDNGRLNFKVVAFTELTPSSFTGVQDYMTNINSAVGVATVNVPQGKVRIQIEWDLASLPADPNLIDSCVVTLTTNKGTVDSLDTTFLAGTADQNGTLDLADFQAPVGATALAVMPASIGVSNTDVPFSFDVTSAVKTAAAGFNFFSISGRVDEGLAGQGSKRGLQIRSTATGNLAAGTEPKLTCNAPPPTESLTWTITSLPSSPSRLLDPSGSAVFVGQTFDVQPTLTFVSSSSGSYFFDYSIINGVFDTGRVTITISPGDDCAFNGRPPGCVQ